MQSLPSSREIRAVRSSHRRAGSSAMVVHARSRAVASAEPRDREARVAVVAARRVGNAVRRNRAKRRLRAAAAAADLPVADIVVDARPGSLTAPFTALCADVARLSRQALHREPRR